MGVYWWGREKKILVTGQQRPIITHCCSLGADASFLFRAWSVIRPYTRHTCTSIYKTHVYVHIQDTRVRPIRGTRCVVVQTSHTAIRSAPFWRGCIRMRINYVPFLHPGVPRVGHDTVVGEWQLLIQMYRFYTTLMRHFNSLISQRSKGFALFNLSIPWSDRGNN